MSNFNFIKYYNSLSGADKRYFKTTACKNIGVKSGTFASWVSRGKNPRYTDEQIISIINDPHYKLPGIKQ